MMLTTNLSFADPGTALAETPSVAETVEIELARIASRVEPFFGEAFIGLYVGGGYGRGEGGRRWRDGDWRPENDYDLFVVVRGDRRAIRRWQARVDTELLPDLLALALSVDIELAVLGETQLPRLGRQQMFADLRDGHRTVAGDATALGRIPQTGPLPAIEGLRLLVNRGALLLMAADRLMRPSELTIVEREEVDRWLHKAVLAVGDASLIAAGQHSPMLRSRIKRVRRLATRHPQHPIAVWADEYARSASQRLEGYDEPPLATELRSGLAAIAPRYGLFLREARRTTPIHLVDRLRRRTRRLRAVSDRLIDALARLGQLDTGVDTAEHESLLSLWRCGV